MADNDIRPPVGGGNPRSPKRKHGRGWLKDRARAGRSWRERKMRSYRYCPPTKTRG